MAAIMKHLPHPQIHHPNVQDDNAVLEEQLEDSVIELKHESLSTTAQALGDDEGAEVPLAERAQAEDAELRKLFHISDKEVRMLVY